MAKPVYLGDASKGEIEITELRCIHQTPYVVAYDDRVKFPNGSEGTYFRWHWNAPYGVVALPILPDGAALLVEQFRHINRCWRLEAPRGLGSEQRTPEETVALEVFEETGVRAERIELLRTVGDEGYPLHMFLVYGQQDPQARIDPDEAIRGVHRVTPEQRQQMLFDRRILDAETLFLLAAWGFAR